MALNIQHLLSHMSDTLGGGELPTGLDAVGVLNQAGEHLHSMHAWRWAQGRSTLLDLRGTISGTAATFDGTDALTDAGAFTNYTFVDGDEIQITGGTGVTEGFYEISARASANALTIPDIGAAASDVSYTVQPHSIDLPDDLRDIISIIRTDSTSRHITLTSLTEVLRAREEAGPNDNFWYGAVSYVGSPPSPVLEIGPGAGSNITGAFRMFYRRRWLRLSSDSTAVDVPEFCENLLIELVRAFARGYVREDQASISRRLAEIEAGPIFRAARMSDGNIQPFGGKLRGGGPEIWRQRESSDFLETTSRINLPS